MKKICLIFTLLTVFLCGCSEQKIPETGFMDFDEKDKEFGQFQGRKYNRIEEYTNEMDNIYINVNSYVDAIMTSDAKKIVEVIPWRLINFLASSNGVNYESAIEIAMERIQGVFDKSEVYDLKDAWQKKTHQIKITQIKIFPQRAELKDAYLNCGIKITDAIEVRFEIAGNDIERESRLRLVKFENGTWAPDADYFF